MNKRNLLIAIPALCSGYLHGQTQPASPNVIYILWTIWGMEISAASDKTK